MPSALHNFPPMAHATLRKGLRQRWLCPSPLEVGRGAVTNVPCRAGGGVRPVLTAPLLWATPTPSWIIAVALCRAPVSTAAPQYIFQQQPEGSFDNISEIMSLLLKAHPGPHLTPSTRQSLCDALSWLTLPARAFALAVPSARNPLHQISTGPLPSPPSGFYSSASFPVSSFLL